MKPGIILLHGALGSSAQLDALKENLSDIYVVQTFNFHGHGGESLNDRDFSIELFAEQLEGFILGRQLKPAHIFGYSMGGYVALYLASQKPGLIASVFTYATKFNWSPESASREINQLDPEVILEKVPAFAAQLKERHAPGDWVVLLKQTQKMMESLGENPPLNPIALKNIRIPVCIAAGDADKMVSVEESAKVVECMPDARLLVLEKFIHAIEKVDTRELAKHITELGALVNSGTRESQRFSD